MLYFEFLSCYQIHNCFRSMVLGTWSLLTTGQLFVFATQLKHVCDSQTAGSHGNSFCESKCQVRGGYALGTGRESLGKVCLREIWVGICLHFIVIEELLLCFQNA